MCMFLDVFMKTNELMQNNNSGIINFQWVPSAINDVLSYEQGATKFCIVILSIMTFSLKCLLVTLSIEDIQHNDIQLKMLQIKCNYAECYYAECYYAKCHYAECHSAECHFPECNYAECHYVECRDAKKHVAPFITTLVLE